MTITLNIARSAEEAERQAKGETLTTAEAIYGDDINENARPENFFDPNEDGEERRSRRSPTTPDFCTKSTMLDQSPGGNARAFLCHDGTFQPPSTWSRIAAIASLDRRVLP